MFLVRTKKWPAEGRQPDFGRPPASRTASDLVFVPAHFGPKMLRNIVDSKGFGDFLDF